MKKIKRSIFQSLKKDLKKGFKRFYWFLYTFIKYYYLTIKFKFFINIINNNKISLLLPSRERSNKFKRMLNSLQSKCLNIDRVEILLLLDEDDKQIVNYKSLIENNFKNLNIKLVIKNLKTHALRNNYLASLSSGDILFPANDDMIFISNDWDHNIDKEFSKIDMNKPYCLWINSGKKYNYLHCDFPILNRAWYKSLGYIGSEFFNFWYLDTWICDLSFKSKKFLVSNKITVEQLSADTHENEVDNTFLKNKKDGIPEKDFLIWNDTENNRKIDANKLI